MIKNKKIKISKMLLIIFIFIVTVFIGTGCSIYKDTVDRSTIENKIKEVRFGKNYVQVSHINKTFLNAIVAVEDHRFYKHGDINLISIARAMIINIRNGEIIEGGSTIPQQLAKNLFLSSEQTLDRKFDEISDLYFYCNENYTSAIKNENVYFPSGQLTFLNAAKGKNPRIMVNDGNIFTIYPEGSHDVTVVKGGQKLFDKENELLNLIHKERRYNEALGNHLIAQITKAQNNLMAETYNTKAMKEKVEKQKISEDNQNNDNINDNILE